MEIVHSQFMHPQNPFPSERVPFTVGASVGFDIGDPVRGSSTGEFVEVRAELGVIHGCVTPSVTPITATIRRKRSDMIRPRGVQQTRNSSSNVLSLTVSTSSSLSTECNNNTEWKFIPSTPSPDVSVPPVRTRPYPTLVESRMFSETK